MAQFTLTRHMINKSFLLLGLAAEYIDLDAVDGGAINIATDHQMFMILTGELS